MKDWKKVNKTKMLEFEVKHKTRRNLMAKFWFDKIEEVRAKYL